MMKKREKANVSTSSKEEVPSVDEKSPSSQWLPWLLLFRVLNALLCVSGFVPDEYWQSLEIAHGMVFGYGHRTWEWRRSVRGFTRPLVYALLYKVLALLHFDWPCLLIVLPRILHAVLAAVGDLYVLKAAELLFGKKAGKYALWCNLASWFTFYCITRTLSNSIETSLTPIILFYWTLACRTSTQDNKQNSVVVYLVLVGVSCLLRPTSIVLWAPVVLAHLWLAVRYKRLATALRSTVIVGSLTLLWSVLIDSYFYGKFVVVQWGFFEFNVLEGHSALYGASPWHWYITEDLGVLLFTSLPLCVLGVWVSEGRWSKAPFAVAVWQTLFLSALSHKEHRYLFIVVPIGSIYAGLAISWLYQKYNSAYLHYLINGLLLANLPMAVYFSLVHQRGAVAIMDHVRNDLTLNSSVLFLMPCHSTPYYSHIHTPVRMDFLECPPPVDPEYVDIEGEFYADPLLWLESHYHEPSTLPSHIVIFEVLAKEIEEFLGAHNYVEVTRLFHSHFPEARKSKYVLLLKRHDKQKQETNMN